MISILFSDSVEGYNLRLKETDKTVLLPKNEIDDMSQAGKIGFGIPYGSNPADYQEALDTAYQGFEDGLYRVFVGEQEMESLDDSTDPSCAQRNSYSLQCTLFRDAVLPQAAELKEKVLGVSSQNRQCIL